MANERMKLELLLKGVDQLSGVKRPFLHEKKRIV